MQMRVDLRVWVKRRWGKQQNVTGFLDTLMLAVHPLAAY